MKYLLILLFAFPAIYPVFAQNKILFINPAYIENAAMLQPEAEGEWHSDFLGDISIIKTGENFYHLCYGGPLHPALYEAVFFEVQGHLFIDLMAVHDSIFDKDYENNFLPTHFIAKVSITSNNFSYSELKYDWLYRKITQGISSLNYFFHDAGTIITSPTRQVESFLAEHIDDKDAFNEEETFTRKSKRKSPAFIINNDTTWNVGDAFATQTYPLSFPMKDGWLGGDADISVPMTGKRTLWLFGDTYIGNKRQTNRDSIVTMVSNTAAITGTTGNGKFYIDYYWKNMYSPQQHALFQSHTRRYVYWVADAFAFEGNLYVWLSKTGPRPGSRDGDLFAFTPLGYSFAIVKNFENILPDQWEPEFISFPFFNDSLYDAAHFIRDGNWLYFFLKRKIQPDSLFHLVRLPISNIVKAEKHFEYYSQSQQWKPGINANDMLIVFNHQPVNTIRYHPDLKLWVMICGPGFFNSNITIHTAPALTGPWSDGKVIYTCAEQTPGNSIYNTKNFCYWAKEHQQFYNKKTHTLLITYDWNNTDFNTIQHNANIYVPRIINVIMNK